MACLFSLLLVLLQLVRFRGTVMRWYRRPPPPHGSVPRGRASQGGGECALLPARWARWVRGGRTIPLRILTASTRYRLWGHGTRPMRCDRRTGTGSDTTAAAVARGAFISQRTTLTAPRATGCGGHETRRWAYRYSGSDTTAGRDGVARWVVASGGVRVAPRGGPTC